MKTNPVKEKDFIYNKTHILLLMSTNKIESFHLLKDGVNSMDIILFLKEALIDTGLRYEY